MRRQAVKEDGTSVCEQVGWQSDWQLTLEKEKTINTQVADDESGQVNILFIHFYP